MSIRGARSSRRHRATEGTLGPIDLQLAEGRIYQQLPLFCLIILCSSLLVFSLLIINSFYIVTVLYCAVLYCYCYTKKNFLSIIGAPLQPQCDWVHVDAYKVETTSLSERGFGS